MTICLALIACKKRIEVDFSVSPESPRAGQSVRFSNLSTGGEEWEWDFGDLNTSSLKSPAHTFKKPGIYKVILKVDKKNNLTRTKTVTVSDTIPTYSCTDSIFEVYKDYTFTANVYNPYNLKVQYEWSLPYTDSTYAIVTDTSMNKSSLTLYFICENKVAPLKLRVIVDGKDTTEILREMYIHDVPTNSVLIRTTTGDYRQRIFGKRYDMPEEDEKASALLDKEQDTMQVYNDYQFTLEMFEGLIPGIEGFHIANRKLYFRDSLGLWVANIDGSFLVPIDTSLHCDAMTLDKTDNRIYWANEDGVWYMPFIGSDNNRFITEPQQLNMLEQVILLSTDPEKK